MDNKIDFCEISTIFISLFPATIKISPFSIIFNALIHLLTFKLIGTISAKLSKLQKNNVSINEQEQINW